ncbi:hypothetical protein FOZ63_030060, partial [Perkinsus olseni]
TLTRRSPPRQLWATAVSDMYDRTTTTSTTFLSLLLGMTRVVSNWMRFFSLWMNAQQVVRLQEVLFPAGCQDAGAWPSPTDIGKRSASLLKRRSPPRPTNATPNITYGGGDGCLRGGRWMAGERVEARAVPLPPDEMVVAFTAAGGRERRSRSSRGSINPGPPGYSLVEELGRGGCATVYRGVCRASAASVALKRVDKTVAGLHLNPVSKRQAAKVQADLDSAYREIAVLRALEMGRGNGGPSRVCGLIEVLERKRALWMVLELCPGVPIGRAFTTLQGEFVGGKRIYCVRPTHLFHRVIADRDDFGRVFVQDVVRQILEGLLELADCGYIHGDIKPDNVMLDAASSHLAIKLIDLGSAVRPGREKALFEPAATLEYMPPEALNATKGAPADGWKVDTWALGAMILEWASMAPLWLSYPCRAYLEPSDGHGRRSSRRHREGGFVAYPQGGLFAVSGKDPCKIAQRQREVVSDLPLLLDDSKQHGIPLGRWRHALSFLASLLALDPDDRLSARPAAVHPFLLETPEPCQFVSLSCLEPVGLAASGRYACAAARPLNGRTYTSIPCPPCLLSAPSDLSIGPHVQRPLPRRSQHQHNADDLGPLLTITGCSSKTLEGGNSRAYRSRTYNASKGPYDCRQSIENWSSTAGLRPTGLEGYGKEDDDILADDDDDDEWLDDEDDEDDIATSDGQGDRELECGLTARELLDLLSRDITPDDYDTLLKLDQRVPPKTAKPESISNLRVLTRAEVKALASPGDDAAGAACEKCG